MAWQLVFTGQYARSPARYLRQHPNAAGLHAKTLQLLEANPHHPSTRLRALKGKLAGLHSASINLSCRITLALVSEREIVPINVDSHQADY